MIPNCPLCQKELERYNDLYYKCFNKEITRPDGRIVPHYSINGMVEVIASEDLIIKSLGDTFEIWKLKNFEPNPWKYLGEMPSFPIVSEDHFLNKIKLLTLFL